MGYTKILKQNGIYPSTSAWMQFYFLADSQEKIKEKKDTTTEEKTFFYTCTVLDWTGNNRPIEFAEIDQKKNRLRNRKPRKEFSQEKYNNYNKFTKTQKRE